MGKLAPRLVFVVPPTSAADDIARLHLACWREAYSAILPADLIARLSEEDRIAAWRDIFSKGSRYIQAACVAGKPVGFISGVLSGSDVVPGIGGHVECLYVASAFYRRGIGERLLADFRQATEGAGSPSVSVGVLAANMGAIAFYKRQGARLSAETTFNWLGHEFPQHIYVFGAGETSSGT